MDVVLGAAVTGPVARLALVDGSSGDRREVIDESTVDLGPDPAGELASAIIGTQRLLMDDGHRLAATRVCWSDARAMKELREALTAAGISDIAAVRQSDAALAKVREVSGGALLFCDDDTATLSIVDANYSAATTVWASEKVADSDSAGACRTLLSRLSKECGAAQSVFLMGTSPNIGDVAKQIRGEAPVPLMIPDDTDLAFAHGATLADLSADYLGAASAGGVEPENSLDAMGLAQTSLSPQIGQQLAYSMVDDSGSLPLLGTNGNHDPGGIPLQSRMSPLSFADDDDEDDDDPIAAGGVAARPRLVLLGSSVAAVVVIAFAALAITVALGIRPAQPANANAQGPNETLPQVFPTHTMPTFLPLPINPAAPVVPRPDVVTPEGPSGTSVMPDRFPGGLGPAVPEVLPPRDAPRVIPIAPDVPRGPGWGMPGFVMPPMFINVPTPIGVTEVREWHWIRDVQRSTLLLVPNSVQANETEPSPREFKDGVAPDPVPKDLPRVDGPNPGGGFNNGPSLPERRDQVPDVVPPRHEDSPPHPQPRQEPRPREQEPAPERRHENPAPEVPRLPRLNPNPGGGGPLQGLFPRRH